MEKTEQLLSKNWEETNNFIALIDLWFDLFNSRVPYDEKQSRNVHGLILQQQNHTLQEMVNTAHSMRVYYKKDLYPLQKGRIISSLSLPKLYDMVQNIYGLSYLLTYRLNQDRLEHFFACIRQMGSGYDHPSLVLSKYRIKSHLVGKESMLLGSNYNSEKENNDVLISEGSVSSLHVNKSTDHENNEKSLLRELSLTAMWFTTLSFQDPGEEYQDESMNLSKWDFDLDLACMLCGCIAHKFPQYQHLGSKVEKGDVTFVSVAGRQSGKVMVNSDDFFEKLKSMESLFQCRHSESP